MSDSRPVGIFDSGVGGLTVVREFIRLMPRENVVYFGDTARVPYGPKSKETILRFSIENILFLLRFGVKLIIIACNTSASVALSFAERNFKMPLVGVIRPGAEAAARLSGKRKIGVIGTRTTIKIGAYEKQIRGIVPGAKVYSAACPLFVPLVEEGWLRAPVTGEIARRYLMPLRQKGVDTLVLGCTHYPLLKPVIREVMGKEVVLIDSASQTAREAKKNLEREGILAAENGPRGTLRFFVSDEPDNFARTGRRFLGFPLYNVKKVDHV